MTRTFPEKYNHPRPFASDSDENLKVPPANLDREARRTYPEKYNYQRPFASDGDEILRVPPANPDWEARRRSQIVIAGPDEVSNDEIAWRRRMHEERNPYAGKANNSSLILTDEVLWQPRHPVSGAPVKNTHGSRALPRAAKTSVQLTDEMPQGAGQRPPAGYYYNSNYELQPLPSHVSKATEDNIIPTFFGAPDVQAPPPAANGGRALAEGKSSAQRTVADAVMYGRQPGSHAQAEVTRRRASRDDPLLVGEIRDRRLDRRRLGPEPEQQFGERVSEHLAWEHGDRGARGGDGHYGHGGGGHGGGGGGGGSYSGGGYSGGGYSGGGGQELQRTMQSSYSLPNLPRASAFAPLDLQDEMSPFDVAFRKWIVRGRRDARGRQLRIPVAPSGLTHPRQWIPAMRAYGELQR